MEGLQTEKILSSEQQENKEKFVKLSNMVQIFVSSLTQKKADNTLDALDILNVKLRHEGLELKDYKLSNLISFPLRDINEQLVDFGDTIPFDTYDRSIEAFILKICAKPAKNKKK